MANLNSLKKADLIAVIEKQAVELADLREKLLAAHNAAADAKAHAALITKGSASGSFIEWAKEQAAQFGKPISVSLSRKSVIVDGEERFFQPT